MYLPKLSNEEIGCYHSHSSVTIGGDVKSNQPQSAVRSGQLQAEYDAISHELAELKSRLDHLGETLHCHNVRVRASVYPGLT